MTRITTKKILQGKSENVLNGPAWAQARICLNTSGETENSNPSVLPIQPERVLQRGMIEDPQIQQSQACRIQGFKAVIAGKVFQQIVELIPFLNLGDLLFHYEDNKGPNTNWMHWTSSVSAL